jgi:hypothetical protein
MAKRVNMGQAKKTYAAQKRIGQHKVNGKRLSCCGGILPKNMTVLRTVRHHPGRGIKIGGVV